MKSIRLAAVVFGAVMLTGCPAGYVKSGGTAVGFHGDMTSCLREVASFTTIASPGQAQTSAAAASAAKILINSDEAEIPQPEGPYDSELAQNMRDSCMLSKGWRMTKDNPQFFPFN